eukprot:TRINITY_DN264_c0_g1_i5.p1 TRINITY_DN264_c0_g1~~TRINITY_DN264_c0_g1_i5.p1  ORF type:complete len:138 (-),score=15.63 TRINITY_DN264_c0_g1_i5:604-1017(-)
MKNAGGRLPRGIMLRLTMTHLELYPQDPTNRENRPTKQFSYLNIVRWSHNKRTFSFVVNESSIKKVGKRMSTVRRNQTYEFNTPHGSRIALAMGSICKSLMSDIQLNEHTDADQPLSPKRGSPRRSGSRKEKRLRAT